MQRTAGVGSGQNLARQLAAVVIERHVEELRAHPRTLSRRALPAAKERAEIGKTHRLRRRPAEQPRAEQAERDSHHQFAAKTGIGRHRKRQDAAAQPDRTREHGRIGRTKHLQQEIKNDNGDDAGNQCRHGDNIIASAPKSMPAEAQGDHFIWPISLAAPPPAFDISSSAARPPAA